MSKNEDSQSSNGSIKNYDTVNDSRIFRVSDEEFLRIVIVPTIERGKSINPSFNPEDFDSLFVDDGFKNFNAFL